MKNLERVETWTLQDREGLEGKRGQNWSLESTLAKDILMACWARWMKDRARWKEDRLSHRSPFPNIHAPGTEQTAPLKKSPWLDALSESETPFSQFLFENVNNVQIQVKKNSSRVTLRNSISFVVVTHFGTMLIRMQFVGMGRPVWGKPKNLSGMLTHSFKKDCLLVWVWKGKSLRYRSLTRARCTGHPKIALKEAAEDAWRAKTPAFIQILPERMQRQLHLEKGWVDGWAQPESVTQE